MKWRLKFKKNEEDQWNEEFVVWKIYKISKTSIRPRAQEREH